MLIGCYKVYPAPLSARDGEPIAFQPRTDLALNVDTEEIEIEITIALI